MGTDKAFLSLGRLTLLEHAIATARAVCGTIVLVGDKERLRPFGWVVEDMFRGQGPLAGIHAGLSSASAENLNLFLAVDTPAISAKLLEFLLDTAERTNAMVTVPRANGHTQPLCAVYRKGFALVAEQALMARQNKIDPLFSQVPCRIIEEEQIKALGFPSSIFDNVNTPDDWQRMQQRFGATNE
jgi:molybdopterin-guanine dinucleotide biosynthesis protein A